MYLLVDFGNKENKKKRKAAESAMVENSLGNLYSNEYTDNPNSDEMNKLRKENLKESRKRRNSVEVDPLKKRSLLMRGEEKILAPYDSKTASRLPEWSEKQNRGKYGNYTGIDNYLPKKGESIAIERNKPKPAPTPQPVKQAKEPVGIVQKSVPFRRKPVEITKGLPQQILNKPTLNLPDKKFDTSAIKPKSGNMMRNLAIGAIGLGAVGAGLSLANHKKKEKQNNG